MKEELQKGIALSESCTAELLPGSVLHITGPKGEVTRSFRHPKITVRIQEKEENVGGNVEGKAERKVLLHASAATRREKTIIGSFAAHIRNMVRGVQEPFEYRLKICSGHFPMNVSVSNGEFVLKNFFGESTPRRVKLVHGATVNVVDKEVIVSSPDKEAAGNMAGRIEQLCSVGKRDRRIFMDGIWITDKGGKKI